MIVRGCAIGTRDHDTICKWDRDCDTQLQMEKGRDLQLRDCNIQLGGRGTPSEMLGRFRKWTPSSDSLQLNYTIILLISFHFNPLFLFI